MPTALDYHRLVIGYHGCEEATARAVLLGEVPSGLRVASWAIFAHSKPMPFHFTPTPDPEEAAQRVFARLQAMTREQRRQTLIDSGILTETGEVHERYRHAIVPIESVKAVAMEE